MEQLLNSPTLGSTQCESKTEIFVGIGEISLQCQILKNVVLRNRAQKEVAESQRKLRDPDTAITENGTWNTRSSRVSKPPMKLEQNWT